MAQAWSLFHLLTNRRLDGLSAADARSRIRALDKADWPYWFAWTAGFEDWVPVTELQARRSAAKAADPAAGAERAAGEERRRSERLEARFRVILKRGQECFRTFSSDVSKGGALLERKAPKRLLGHPCEIFIARPDLRESLRLIGVPMADERNAMRLKFTEVDADSLRRLGAWVRGK